MNIPDENLAQMECQLRELRDEATRKAQATGDVLREVNVGQQYAFTTALAHLHLATNGAYGDPYVNPYRLDQDPPEVSR